MRDQNKKEMDTDPMDGGIVVPAGGDGIQRVPVGPDGMPMDPEMPADDRAKMALGIDPDAEEAPPPEGQEAEFDPSFIVKKGKK